MRLPVYAAALLLAPATLSAQRPAPVQQAPRAQAPQIPTRVTTKALLDVCGSNEGACLTYVLGAADAWTSAFATSGRPQVFCFPQSTTNQQISQTVIQFLRARPQEGPANAGLSLLGAFSTIYPCAG